VLTPSPFRLVWKAAAEQSQSTSHAIYTGFFGVNRTPDTGHYKSDKLSSPRLRIAQPKIYRKAGVAQLWFVTIHPFDDGNGRIARAIAAMMLARSDKSPQRFYSMSAQIRKECKTYYEILQATQKGDLDITLWLEWFLDCLGRSFEGAETIFAAVLRKARFWEERANTIFNDRQRKIVNLLLNGFEGKLTSSQWARLAKCSHDTALRDIEDLVRKEVLTKDPADGRSTSYSLVALERAERRRGL
jgi:Fic family protein